MKRICVIGGANIDICGSSLEPLRNFDSNPGTVEIAYGGVGRNIAQICTLLGQNVSFVSCFSEDNYGQMMKQDCQRLGMDCSFSKVVSSLPSSMYIAILDDNRDMKIAMSDMRILREMDEEMLNNALQSLNQDDRIIIDANLDVNCIKYVLNHAPCPIAADPVSVAKSERLAEELEHIAVFKPNQFEAAKMNGIAIKDIESAKKSLQWFLDQGVKEIIISMADRGILLGTAEKMSWFTHRMIYLHNATGGGDSMLGAYVSERLAGADPFEAIRAGISAAVVTIEEDAVRQRSLTMENIRNKIMEMDIKEKIL